MHPELQLLESRYIEIVTAAQQGQMSEADAVETLSHLMAIDGDGATWSIDPVQGQFVRALPGQQPVLANPAMFTPARLPQPDLGGFPGSPEALWGAPPSLAPIPESGGTFGSAVGSASSAAGGILGKVSGLLSGKGRTVILIAVALVVIVALLAMRSRGSAPEPVVPDSGQVTTSQSPEPSAPPTASESAPSAAVPSESQVKQVLGMLTSGSVKTVGPLLSAASDKPAYLLSTAALSGAVKLGFTLTASQVSAVDGGAVVTVTASRDDAIRGTFQVTLMPRGKGWVLAAPIVAGP